MNKNNCTEYIEIGGNPLKRCSFERTMFGAVDRGYSLRGNRRERRER